MTKSLKTPWKIVTQLVFTLYLEISVTTLLMDG